MNDLLTRDSFRVVVTDSGFGGMAVASDLVKRLAELRAYRKVEVVFFNCRPAETLGYGMMKSHMQKTQVFSNALEVIMRKFNPDAILIACNTLSVLLEHTAFADNPGHPKVFGIVDLGVDAISNHLREREDRSVIMFATPSTVESGIHKQRLISQGIQPERLFYQGCELLPDTIERVMDGDETAAIIDKAVAQSRKSLDESGQTQFPIAAFLCTHFGYVSELFRTAFQRYGILTAPVIDPTPLMAMSFLEGMSLGQFNDSEVVLKVFSHTRISKETMNTMIRIFRQASPLAAEAMENYVFTPSLFDIEGRTDCRAGILQRHKQETSHIETIGEHR